MGETMVNKRGAMNQGLVLVGVVLLVLALVQSGTLKLSGFQAATEAPKTGGADVATLAGGLPCPVESTTLGIGPVQDKYDSTQTTSTLKHALFVNGVDKGLYADGATATVSPGDKVEIIYAAKNGTYLNDKASFTIPCKGAIDTGALNGGAWKVTKFANLTVRLFNPSNGNVNAASDNESLAANQIKNFRLELEAGSRQGFTETEKVAVVCEGNNNQFSNIVVKGAGWTQGGAIPSPYTVSATANRAFVSSYDPLASGSQGGMVDSKIVNGVVTIEAGGTNPAPTSGNVCVVYRQFWVKDPDTGVYRVDYTDQRNTAPVYDQASFQYFVS